MAVKADKRPPVNKPLQERIIDFSSGLNTTISGSLLNKNEAQLANDVSFEQKGTIVPRKGRRKRYSVSFSSAPCTGLGALYRKDGTSRLVVTSDTKIYYDEPHVDIKWDTKDDWDNRGTVGDRVTTSKVQGSLTMLLGVNSILNQATGDATAGQASHTYGYEITPLKPMKVFKLAFKPHLNGTTYKLYIWKVSDKSVVKSVTYTSTKVDTWEEIQFYDAPVTLEKDVKYMIGIFCASENAIYQYPSGTNVVFQPNFTIGSSFKKDSDAYPDVADTAKAFAIDIGYELVNMDEVKFDTDAKWNTGTKTQLTVANNKISLTLPQAPAILTDTMTGGTLDNVIADSATKVRLKGILWADYGSLRWDGTN